MKIINYCIALLLLTSVEVNAKPVYANTAQKVAQSFYADKYGSANPDMTLVYTERDATGTPVYYVFNANTNKGFVIVTADDAAHPIIGYSNEGAFVTPTANNNAFYWLQKRKKEVIAMRNYNVVATSNISDEWTSYTSNNTTHAPHRIGSFGVAPLCNTTWDQSPYYNAYCPGGSVTGCVATAMAQIMKYWSYPNKGIGSNCYYDEQSDGYTENYGDLCATFDTAQYVWADMPNNVTRANNEVAKLMYDCGVSVDMDYSPSSSGASVFSPGPSAYNSFITYFGYDNSTIGEAYNYNYTDNEWYILLENELNNHRPIEYEGFDNTYGGHTWVCDGYDSINHQVEFHMNWGWSGADDGYYSTSNLNPSPYNFDNYTGVVYGIEPPSVALAVKQIVNNTTVSVYPNPSYGIFTMQLSGIGSQWSVEVYDMLGQKTYSQYSISNSQFSINLSSQPKGIYIYKALTETGVLISTGRLVVE